MIPEAVDLLIVGLGPGGGAAAAVAARAGLRVLAVERRCEIGRPVQCAEFIPLALQPYARAPRVAVQSIASMATNLPSRECAASALAGLMIERALFDRSFAVVAHSAGARLCTEARLEGLDQHASSATIVCAQGRRSVSYCALIAADGPRSTVARLLGLPALESIPTRQYQVALVEPSTTSEIFLSAEYPGGYGWLFPKGAAANLGLGFATRRESDLKQPLDHLHMRLVADGRVGSEVLARTGGAIPVGGLRNPLVLGNIAFVGDAGGFTHPITGAGIAAAVLSGEHAAQAAIAGRVKGIRAAFADFAEEMRELYQTSIARALGRRREMLRTWSADAARDDRYHRRGWIAFEEYYANSGEPV